MARRFPLFPVLVLALAAGGAWAYSAPYRAFADLKTAARAGDEQALDELVDFPAFRESLKDNVRLAAERGIDGGGGERSLLGRLGGMVAGAVAGEVVEQFVTPQGIAAIADGVRPGRDDPAAAAEAPAGDGAEAGGERRRPAVRVERGYEDLSTFVVRLHDAGSGDERLALVMRREGLDWRLTGVRLPEPARE